MKRLDDDLLIEVYVKAKHLRLEEEFIAIVEQEMVRRGMNRSLYQAGQDQVKQTNDG